MELIHVHRQIVNGTNSPNDDQSSFSFEMWLATYWYVLFIVLVILVVVCVLICACALKKRPRPPTLHPRSQAFKSTNSHSPDNGGSSEQSHQSSIPTMPSLSADSTPVPSPHSSQHSVGIFNGRNRRTSPRLSSTSSDTLRPDLRSMSSNSSASLMGHSPTRQQDRNSPMERRGSLPRRARSGPMVRVTSMPDVKDNGGLRPSPSTVSVESSSNGRSGVSYKFQPGNDSQTFVEVGVTVHTPGDPDKAVRIATAAALAESARKLAQEAASFIDTGDENVYHHPSSSVHRVGSSNSNRPYHPGSGRSSSFSLSQPSYTPVHSHPVPITTASLDNPSTSLSRVGGGNLRGEHYPHPQYSSYHLPPSSARGGGGGGLSYQPSYNLDEDYISGPGESPWEYSDQPLTSPRSSSSLPYHHHPHRNNHQSFQRGRPYRSSLDGYHRGGEDIHHRFPPQQTRTRVSSVNSNSTRETSFTGGRSSSSVIGSEFINNAHRYPGGSSRRLTSMESNYSSRKIPFHLTAAGRRQSAPTFDQRGVRLDSVRRMSNERIDPLPRVIQVSAEIEPREKPVGSCDMDEELCETPHDRKQSITSNHSSRTKETVEAASADVVVSHSLTQSPSTSTGLSSTYSSQMEEQSPYPSQDNPSEMNSTQNSNETSNDNVESSSAKGNLSSNHSKQFKTGGDQSNKNYHSAEAHSGTDHHHSTTTANHQAKPDNTARTTTADINTINSCVRPPLSKESSTQSSNDSEESAEAFVYQKKTNKAIARLDSIEQTNTGASASASNIDNVKTQTVPLRRQSRKSSYEGPNNTSRHYSSLQRQKTTGRPISPSLHRDNIYIKHSTFPIQQQISSSNNNSMATVDVTVNV